MTHHPILIPAKHIYVDGIVDENWPTRSKDGRFGIPLIAGYGIPNNANYLQFVNVSVSEIDASNSCLLMDRIRPCLVNSKILPIVCHFDGNGNVKSGPIVELVNSDSPHTQLSLQVYKLVSDEWVADNYSDFDNGVVPHPLSDVSKMHIKFRINFFQ